jgi:putative transposase
MDRAGRWHIAFAAIPEPIAGPGTGEVVGIDRGAAVSAALSTGEMLSTPRLSPGRRRRLLNLQRKLARAQRGSRRRAQVKLAIARVKARETDARKDWCEKLSTGLARRFDVIRVEDLKIKGMTRSAKGTLAQPGRNVRQKAGLNRSILESGWGLLVTRLEQKAPGRVQKINPAYTSQTCSACGTRDREARESQACLRCWSCGHAENADVNAAKNIAAGHAVTARGGPPQPGRPQNREPRSPSNLKSPSFRTAEDVKAHSFVAWIPFGGLRDVRRRCAVSGWKCPGPGSPGHVGRMTDDVHGPRP